MILRSKRVACILAALVLGSAIALHAAGAEPPVITLEQYRAELQRIETGVEAIHEPRQIGPLHRTIPAQYRVSTHNGVISVDNAALRKSIGSLFAEKTREVTRSKIEQELRSLESNAIEYDNVGDSADAHNRLTKILAAQEFDDVRGPTLIETWREKISETLERWWDKLLSKLPTSSGGHQEYTWILIAIAACVLAIWLKRTLEKREPEMPREIIPFAPSGKHWRKWLAEARSAAADGRWRDAIHLAYWAGISHLEASGAWTPDSARTPREYLRLIQPNNPSRGELAALTRDFEQIWYGSRAASDQQFAESLQHLERLGCR
jgi:Domain of unknown function (DUF4129)